MNCIHCDAQLPNQAQFCPTCGKPVERKRHEERPRSPRPQGSPEGRAAYETLLQAKKSRSASIRHLFSAAMLTLATVFAVIAVVSNGKGGLVPAGFCAVVLLFSLLVRSDVRLTATQYRALPGSLDAQGDHRCVHCGHRGIYKSSPYRTNHTNADCSKCKTPLWQEPKDR